MNARVLHLVLALMFAAANLAVAQQPDSSDKGQKNCEDSGHSGWMALARRWFASDDTVPTFTIVFGGIKPGSGVALGPAVAYRFTDGSFVQARAEYSIHSYKLAEVRFQSRAIGRMHAVIATRARWQDAPAVALYELGRDAPEARALYGERKTEFSAAAMLRPTAVARAAAGIGYERYRVDDGRTDPSEDESLTFVPALPGLGTRPLFLHTFVAAGVDTRRSGDLSLRGSRVSVAAHRFSDRRDGRFSFSRVVVEGEQLVPVAHERGALSLIGTMWTSSGTSVPFFLMPTLGGGDYLRGYRTYRFRDRDAIVLTAEMRWRVRENVDAAAFVDDGTVAPRLASIRADAMRVTGGVGVRVHTAKTTIFRADVARGAEGFQVLIGFSSRVSAVF